MDPAFLRRLPYKIEVGGPSLQNYRAIFELECAKRNMTMTEEAFALIVHMVTREKGMEPAAYHPRFIVDQVVATCKFMGQSPHFDPRFIEYAINNLRVKRPGDGKDRRRYFGARLALDSGRMQAAVRLCRAAFLCGRGCTPGGPMRYPWR